MHVAPCTSPPDQNPSLKLKKHWQTYGGLSVQVPLPHGGHFVSSVCVGVGTCVVVGGLSDGVKRTVTVSDVDIETCCDREAVYSDPLTTCVGVGVKMIDTVRNDVAVSVTLSDGEMVGDPDSDDVGDFDRNVGLTSAEGDGEMVPLGVTLTLKVDDFFVGVSIKVIVPDANPAVGDGVGCGVLEGVGGGVIVGVNDAVRNSEGDGVGVAFVCESVGDTALSDKDFDAVPEGDCEFQLLL